MGNIPMQQEMILNSKQKSNIQENLLSLYLRLNGYFVTGFIVHSPDRGKIATEIDVLGVRFPYSSEPERQVEADASLDLSTSRLELAICEVKSKGEPLHFNNALLKSPNRIASILRWAGIHKEENIEKLSDQVHKSLQTKNLTKSRPPTIEYGANSRIRGLLCSPERHEQRDNQQWFISEKMLFEYIHHCLCPDNPRDTCTTRYDFGQWGEYEKTVRYFKSREDGSYGTIKNLYEYYQG
ncbi:MAG: hypothetical protein JAY90_19545 [Candidatus Thiodiazotropha lotti]|nr:hypothetical protein [Candidatus Thiodiazotropha lotti]